MDYTPEELNRHARADCWSELNQAHTRLRQRLAHVTPEPPHRLLLIDSRRLCDLAELTNGLIPELDDHPMFRVLHPDPARPGEYLLVHPRSTQPITVVMVPSAAPRTLLEFYA